MGLSSLKSNLSYYYNNQDEISDPCAWRDSAIAERDFSNERAGMYRRYAESTLAAIGNCQEA